MWRQKAKALWAKKGDNTSKLFHRTVNGRQSRSLINKIESREGIILENMRSAEKEIDDYFKKKLYSAEGIPRPIIYGLH